MSKVNGQVEAEDILAAVRPATCLVTIMLANNETGVVMVSRCPPGETDGDVGLLYSSAYFCIGVTFSILECFSEQKVERHRVSRTSL